jgi:chaperonin GroEL
MSHRKAKTAPKIFITDQKKLKALVLETMGEIADAVGRTMGPGGKNVLIESDFPGIANKNTKDGVTVFKSLGYIDSYKHLITEQARSSAERTASEAGDGTTTATVLSNAIIQNIFDFCEKHPRYSPQRAVRRVKKVAENLLAPYIQSRAIVIDEDNKHMLKMVAQISANGDEDMANSVILAFEEIGYGDASHVTIREVSGKTGYKVERIDGFPIPMGYEDSIGKLHTAFINDQANQRCYMEKPLFLLFDGVINDIINILPIINGLGSKYVNEGNSDYKNLVIFAHGFSENVLTNLAFNFADPGTINIIPMVTPMSQFVNSQLQFLMDLSAFTGSKVFGLRDQVSQAQLSDLGGNMESFEAYRFRSTVVGDPDPVNVEVRADDLKKQKETAESKAESGWLEERIGKITNGIAKLTISGGSNGELKEAHDRCEDAVCAVRSAITHGALPGGCRIAIDMALKIAQELEEGDPAREILMPSLMSLPQRLLDNAGYHAEDIQQVIEKLIENPDLVYDIENEKYGKAEELGLFDASKAVSESLNNAVSIASILGTMGAIVCHPRDSEFERREARADSEFMRISDNPHAFTNEANNRP